jgi:hypothetical protein
MRKSIEPMISKYKRSNLPIAPQTIGIDESPIGYSLVSCSPAELTSASPIAGDCGAQTET